MTPTEIMGAEHRLIETVVRSLGGMAAAIERGQRADAATLASAVEFLRVYADKLHHGKEETLLFPMADKVLSDADRKELCAKFAELDRTIGLDAIARLERFARSLAPIAVPSTASGTTTSGGCECGCSA